MRRGGLEGLSPLIIALDTPDLDAALGMAIAVREHVDIVKVGLELFSVAGPGAVRALRREGFEVFLDVKLMDIPNTVSSACLALCPHEPLLVTLHTMGGQEMMRAAAQAVRERCESSGERTPLLIGVTVLTSLDVLALKKLGVSNAPEAQVLRLARLARESGLDGLVTSPLETLAVRREVGQDMVLVTPGIRPSGAGFDDQKRVATPEEAAEAGADFIVVGRPLTRAADPAAAARAILDGVRRVNANFEKGYQEE